MKMKVDICKYKRVSLFWALYDFWSGVFYDMEKRIIYIIIIPTFVIKIERKAKWKT